MNKQEASAIIMLLQTNYPDTCKNDSREALQARINLWASVFADTSVEAVKNAVLAYMATSDDKFAPNVGMIRKQLQEMSEPQRMSETEALSLVMKGLERSIYHSQEEFDKLPPLLQKIVGSPSQMRAWALLDAETVQSVIGSHILRAYRTLEERQSRFERLPQQTRDFISGVAGKLAMPAEKTNL